MRTADSIKLIEYAFANYEYINVKEKIQEEFNKWQKENQPKIEVIKGIITTPQIGLSNFQFEEAPINKNNIKDIEVEITCSKTVPAPIKQNQTIGKVELKVKDDVIVSIDIIIKEEIKKKNTINFMKQLITNYNTYLQNALSIYM